MRKRTDNRRRRSGFTLTEVLLVLAILGVIAAMVVPNLLGAQQKANIMATKQSIAGLEKALQLYAVANGGEYPSMGREELFPSLMAPGQDADGRAIAPYLDKTPKDAWGQPLYYEFPNSKAAHATKPAIWSSGPNKQNEDGAGDDVNNWSDSGK